MNALSDDSVGSGIAEFVLRVRLKPGTTYEWSARAGPRRAFMNTSPSPWIRFAIAVVAPAWVLVTPPLAGAQERAVPRNQPAATEPSAPSPAPAPVSTPRAGQRTPSDGSSGTATPRTGGSSGSGSSGGSTTGRDSGQSTPRSGSEPAVGRRERGDQPIIATAVPRRTPPGGSGGRGVIIVPGGYGFYPWGYGGLGLGGYYGGYYDPWDPYGGGYGGYGGGYPIYTPADSDEGAVRIKVKPREASVYADGYYVGHVDDFDGVFQRLHLSSGPHRIEVRAPQYEPLTFDVYLDPDRTVTYHGDLKKIQ